MIDELSRILNFISPPFGVAVKPAMIFDIPARTFRFFCIDKMPR
jgi:hypothetical protein